MKKEIENAMPNISRQSVNAYIKDKMMLFGCTKAEVLPIIDKVLNEHFLLPSEEKHFYMAVKDYLLKECVL